MKRLVTLFTPMLLVLTIASCQKEKRSSADWGELAAAKLAAINTLTGSIPCSQLAETTIDSIQGSCFKWYFPLTARMKAEFDRLRHDYLFLLDKKYAAAVREGVIIEPCFHFWDPPGPIRLDCDANRVEVVTLENMPMDEAEQMAGEHYSKIQHYLDTVSCSGHADWTHVQVVALDPPAIEYIPVRAYAGFSPAIIATLSSYHVLANRLMEARGAGAYPEMGQWPKGVSCEDGKPVLRFE